MADIHHKQFPAHLKKIAGGPALPPVFLIHGEEYLCREAFGTLIETLLPDGDRSLNYDPVDSAGDVVAEAVVRMNTYGLIPERKVVAVLDAPIFHTRQDTRKVLDQARKAHVADNMAKAARSLLHLMALTNVDLDAVEDLGVGSWLEGMGCAADSQWVGDVVRHCRTQRLTAAPHVDGGRMLERALEKGFPADNHLVITTDVVDRRRSLYKLIAQQGVVVDCAVPKGDRQADKTVQESVLLEKMAGILDGVGKAADRAAVQAMLDMTGFDLRTFVGNVEKLVSFVGDRKTITADDVRGVLKRTKKDPIYAFTNAVADRDLQGALFYMDSLLTDSDAAHPLQLFAAVVNQVRRLLLVKGFVEADAGRVWSDGCPYNLFQSRVIPAVERWDKELLDALDGWEAALSAPDTDGEAGNATRKGKKKSSGPVTDLVIARQPKNAYPIYQTFKKSERFTRRELVSVIQDLADADHRMKTTGQDPRRVLEQVLVSICAARPVGAS